MTEPAEATDISRPMVRAFALPQHPFAHDELVTVPLLVTPPVEIIPESYRETVREAANGDAPSSPVLNRSAGHARVIVETLFEKAQERVDILTGALYPGVYAEDGLVRQAVDFMSNRNGQMRIAIDDPVTFLRSPCRLVDEIREKTGGGRLEIRAVPKGLSRLIEYHFALADRVSYRLEGDKTSFNAVAMFHNPLGGEILAARFEEIWVRSEAFDAATV